MADRRFTGADGQVSCGPVASARLGRVGVCCGHSWETEWLCRMSSASYGPKIGRSSQT